MPSQPLCLDLFCGAGAAGEGYHRAGFRVVGVDHRPQPRYPFRFIQADALEFLRDHGRCFDLVHASPPCQRYTPALFCRTKEVRDRHPDLLGPTLQLLRSLGRPFVVENLPQAPWDSPVIELCGLMFGLRVFRHRRFACSHILLAPPHPSHKGHKIGVNGFVCVAGHGDPCRRYRQHLPPEYRTKRAWASAMRIDWMTRNELAQAIPPAYTEFLGRQLRRALFT